MTTKNSLFFILFLFQASQLNAQTEKGFLKIGGTVSTNISPKERHRYKIKMAKDEIATLKLLQKGTDVIISTFDFTGEKLNDFDSPNGSNGYEVFSITSTHKGDYFFEIKSFEENTSVGKYDLTIRKIKHIAVTPFEKTDELLEQYDNENDPGIAISVVKDGKFIYKKGFGIANLEYNIPITPTTVFQVASVSKQFTVFSILLLEKEGKLSLDDDIRKYLPDLPDYGHKISIRNLTNHTSGIKDQGDLTALVGIKPEDVISNKEIVNLIAHLNELNFIPNTAFEYCNSGYNLLAEIVERVSGKSFAAFTTERIFVPLKMKNSQFPQDFEKIIKNKAYSYAPAPNGYKKRLLNNSIVGSTGLNTTVEDLSLWAMNFENPVVGDSTIFDKMKVQSQLTNEETLSYALGQELKNYKGLNVIFHGGGDAGYRSYLLRIPEHHFSVAIIGNSEAFNPLDVVYKIVDIFLADKQKISNPNKQELTINEEILKSYNGNYEVMPGLIINISNDEKNLYLQIKGENQKILLPSISHSEFLFTGLPHSKIVFLNNGELKWHLSDFVYIGKKIDLKPFDETKINFSEFVGKYYSPELQTSYTFVLKDNQLMATHPKNANIKMSILQPDIFISSEGFFKKVEFVRNEKSVIIRCKISGSRAKEIKFEKIE